MSNRPVMVVIGLGLATYIGVTALLTGESVLTVLLDWFLYDLTPAHLVGGVVGGIVMFLGVALLEAVE